MEADAFAAELVWALEGVLFYGEATSSAQLRRPGLGR